MRTIIAAAFLGLAVLAGPPAMALPAAATQPGEPLAAEARYSRDASASFRRCMRAKYGRNYFRGVIRPHRYFMAQACGW